MSGDSIVVTSGRKRRKKGFHPIRFLSKCFFTLLSLSVIAGFILAFHLYRKYSPIAREYYDYAAKLVQESSPGDFRAEQTSYIYNSEKKQIAKLKLDRDVTYVSYEDIPQQVIDAVVSIEDKRYWEHEGVDWLSTAKAGVMYLQDSEDVRRGGSTITQQLVKNQYLSFEKSIERKSKEILIALQMEKRYTKKQILEFYLNNINYANGYYGIGAAAKGYFNKKLKDLSLEETAFLCAIPNNPSLYDPLVRLENTTARRNLILNEMYSQGYITQMQYLEASNSPIHFYKRSKKSYNYEVSYAINCAVRVLMRKAGFRFRYEFRGSKDYSKYQKKYESAFADAKTQLYSGGYRVYTSIDSKVQKKLQKTMDEKLKGFTAKDKDGVFKLQGACTIVDNSNGNVIAMVGGRHQNFDGIITLNRGYQSYRQPGSTIKPLAVYAPSFEKGYTANTFVSDEPIPDGPSNSNGKYEGKITLRHAVESSKNVVAWNVMESIGVKYGVGFIQKMNFSKILPSDYYLSSALGGLTYGVTTEEMAGGYCTLFNDGIYREPTCVVSMKDSQGITVSLGRESYRVYSESAARTMTDVLQGVAKNGTARGLQVAGGMPIACKTGTTNNQTNGWFCAYTPYYTTACYVGYDREQSLSSLWGSTYPLEISKEIQDYLCTGKKIVCFKKPQKKKAAVRVTDSPVKKQDDSVDAVSPENSDTTDRLETDQPETVRTPKPKSIETPEPADGDSFSVEMEGEDSHKEEPENTEEPCVPVEPEKPDEESEGPDGSDGLDESDGPDILDEY